MNPSRGTPEVFVIGGGGSGIAVYNRLQRQSIPFVAGILQKNDLEYPTARALAAEVVSQKAFYPIEKAQIEEAKSGWSSVKPAFVLCRWRHLDH